MPMMDLPPMQVAQVVIKRPAAGAGNRGLSPNSARIAPIAISDPNALNLVRVGVFVVPLDEADRRQLKALKTDDTVKIKGLVQDVVLRVSVQVAPAILVRSKG